VYPRVPQRYISERTQVKSEHHVKHPNEHLSKIFAATEKNFDRSVDPRFIVDAIGEMTKHNSVF
jgi:hypothetical protein